MPSWSFYWQEPTDPVRNPIAGEFFSTEAVGDVTEALVREGIQNTLDARRKLSAGKREPANVRIYLSEAGAALSTAKANRWFNGVWPHVLAPDNGLRDQPNARDTCPFLVFEDFGTSGLNGDPAEHQIHDSVTNHFLNFFRAEGHSDKGEQDRGSWGVGKSVFPRASRISSFFGLTVRHDDRRCLLLGRAILKFHRIGAKAYKSDGYFGEARSDGFMLPSEEGTVIDSFRADFAIKRTNEPGLTIVVPWYEMDSDDGITRDKVVGAILRGFFYPILMGHLSVTVATHASELTLDQVSILSQVQAIGGPIAEELVPLLELSEWAQTRTEAEFESLVAPERDAAQKWSSQLVPASVIQHIRESLAQRQRVSLRVPMAVQARSGEPVETFFKVFLDQSERDAEKPIFIRDELIISDVKSRRVSKTQALVIVEDKPLASLLRDAETPAHTQWNQGTSHFKNKYKFGTSVINFVTHSVSDLLRFVNQSDRKPDPSLTVDFFSLPAQPDDDEAVPARRRKAKQRSGPEPPSPTDPPPPARLRRFRIDRMNGGFKIKAGDPDAERPEFIRIRVAYDVRRGNPLMKHHPADVDADSLQTISDNESAVIEETQNVKKKGLIFLVRLLKPDFHLEITGFDADRDLYVKAEVKEPVDAD